MLTTAIDAGVTKLIKIASATKNKASAACYTFAIFKKSNEPTSVAQLKPESQNSIVLTHNESPQVDHLNHLATTAPAAPIIETSCINEPEEEAALLVAKEPIQKTVAIQGANPQDADTKNIDQRRLIILRSLVQALLEKKSAPIGLTTAEHSTPVIASPTVIANPVAIDATAKRDEEDEIMLHVKKLINRSGLGEIALQKLLYLLDLEMVVINHLLAGEHGYVLAQSLEKRNKAMECAGSSALRIYYEIMDKAADNKNALPKIEEYIDTNGSEKIRAALNKSNKERFLMQLLHVVTSYYRKIQQLLYDIGSVDFLP